MNGKPLLAGVCALCLACGYIVGISRTPSGRDGQPATNASDRPAHHPSRETRARRTDDSALLASILGGRPVSEIPAADLAAFIAKLSKYEPGTDPLTAAKQRYQLQLLLAKIPPRHLGEIATAIHSDPGEHRSTGNLQFVLSALALVDPDRALDWLQAHGNTPALLSSVLSGIARNDPERAAALLRQSHIEGNAPSNQMWTATISIGQAMAALGKDPLFAFIDSLPAGQQSNVIYNSIHALPEGERIGMLDEIHRRIAEGTLRNTSLDHLFTNVLSSDAPAAREWFSKLPEGNEKDTLRLNTAASLYQRGEKDASTRWMREALAVSPGKEKETFGKIMRDMSHQSPEAIAHFAILLPESVEHTADELENAAASSLYSGYSGLISISGILPDPHQKALLIANALEKARTGHGVGSLSNPTDLETLTTGIATLGLTGEDAALVNAALEAAKNAPPPPAD